MRPTLTVDDLTARGVHPRTVRRLFERWQRQGFPAVHKAPRPMGGVAWHVDRAHYEALVRGDPPEIAKAA